MDEHYLTVDDVAKKLQVSRVTVYAFIKTGRLESVKLGKSRRIALSALQRFIEQAAAAEAGKGDTNPAE